MPEPLLACHGCGRTKPGPTGDPSDVFPSQHCGDCPPWRCEDCGEMCSAVDLCSCWLSFEGMPLADQKAIFAANGISLGVPYPAPTDPKDTP